MLVFRLEYPWTTYHLFASGLPCGHKEILGMWIGKAESSSFRMSVLTELKARGVEDILITVTDNLNGFTDTIKAVFPQSTTQIGGFEGYEGVYGRYERDIHLGKS